MTGTFGVSAILLGKVLEVLLDSIFRSFADKLRKFLSLPISMCNRPHQRAVAVIPIGMIAAGIPRLGAAMGLVVV